MTGGAVTAVRRGRERWDCKLFPIICSSPPNSEGGMMKHTKGPWKINIDTGEYGVYHLYSPDIGGDEVFEREEIDEANARLIAAAPELLDALRDLLYAATLPMKERREGWDSARALIKKVAGE